MKLETAELLATYGAGDEVRPDYSGRGMDGETTAAVVCDQRELLRAVAEIMAEGDDSDRELAAEALRRLRSDDMGRSKVWY